ncbi:restriction endonuclease subunit S [uncultured Paraglaciecola sp.]|uniref:restriction endonuclease subunit S n=1 Tax=uncultured Paraglaciecola sp. TaxID=1765024 RepID=UPI0025986DED|nr:restriction endonuclease subunit S [uncultured Paraglaciecola sp.]
MVPNGWKPCALADITKWSSGGTPSKSNPNYWGGDIPWISAASMRGHYFSSSELAITELAVSEKAKMAEQGTLLLLVRGSMLWNKIPVGITTRRLAFNQDVKCLTPISTKLDVLFLLYWFLAKENKLMGMVTGTGIGAGKLDTNDLQSLDVFLPPLLEQRRIAKILSTWGKAISSTERLINNSKQQKKALMQQLLTAKKRLLDDSGKPFVGDYNRVNLSELASIDKSSLGKKTPEDFEFSYISLSDVETGKIAGNLEKHVFASSPSRARRKVSCGDILLATVRPNLKGFAKVKAEHDGMIASTGFSVITPKKNVSGDYLYHYLFSCHITGQINALVVGSNYPAINSSDVSGLKVYIPCYDEQKKIAKVLNNADESLAQLEQQLADLKQEKKALMQQLLTGKRRVIVDE